MRLFFMVFCGAVFLALVASFLGVVHPAGDMLAVFRLPLAGLAALCCLRLPRRLALVGMAVAMVSVVPVAWAVSGPAPVQAGRYVLYQKNMFARPADRRAFVADVIAQAPDFLTLQEVSPKNAHVLPALAGVLPTQHFCPGMPNGEVAVASRFPAVPGTGLCAERLAGMQLETPEGPVWLVSIHLRWPFPHNQADQVAHLLPLLEGLQGKVVIAGDFNMVPWTHVLHAVAQATRTRRAGPARASFDIEGLPVLPIDHVLSPGGGRVALRPKFGSDHRGLLARIAL